MVRETWVQSQVESYQRLKKWYLMPPCLALSTISTQSILMASHENRLSGRKTPTPSHTQTFQIKWEVNSRVVEQSWEWSNNFTYTLVLMLLKNGPSGYPRLRSPSLLTLISYNLPRLLFLRQQWTAHIRNSNDDLSGRLELTFSFPLGKLHNLYWCCILTSDPDQRLCWRAWLIKWDRVKIPQYSQKLMHRKRVTSELMTVISAWWWSNMLVQTCQSKDAGSGIFRPGWPWE